MMSLGGEACFRFPIHNPIDRDPQFFRKGADRESQRFAAPGDFAPQHDLESGRESGSLARARAFSASVLKPATEIFSGRVGVMARLQRTRWPRGTVFLGYALVLCACGQPWDPPASRLRVWEESGASLKETPIVARIHLLGAPHLVSQDVWIVRGEVSSVSQGRLRKKDPPLQLQENRIPLAVWQEGMDWVLAPTVVLESQQVYSIVALGWGLLAVIETADQTPEILHYFGPPTLARGDSAVFCPGAGARFEREGESAPQTSEELPVGVHWGIAPDGWGAPCLTIENVSSEDGFFLPPQQLGGVLVAPKPIGIHTVAAEDGGSRAEGLASSSDAPAEVTGVGPRPGGATGEPAELCFEGGCFEIDGPSLAVHVEAPFLALELSSERETRFLVTEIASDGPLRLGPLQADTAYRARLLLLDGKPLGEPIGLSFRSGSFAPRLVLTEVFANPRGPEPQSEWIEIFNPGTASASLSGFSVADDDGVVLLPDVTLLPGAWALVVRSDFQSQADVVPQARAVPVVVPKVGGNGLRNSGETVRLLDRDGALVSQIPALSVKEGVSVARRDLWGGDEAENFAAHAPPGCSPGGENQFEE